VFVVQLPRGIARDDVMAGLRAAGVQSKPYLPAIHLMSFYRERFGHRPGAGSGLVPRGAGRHRGARSAV
jgi:perosamine synthetase